MTKESDRVSFTRRAALAVGAAAVAAPALGQDKCPLGPPPGHVKGPPVFRDYDQVELDAAYDQDAYQPHTARVNDRLAILSYEARDWLSEPLREAYGGDPVEGLDVWRSDRPGAPVFVFVHGGIWRYLSAADSGFAAETFVRAGANYVAIDFANVGDVDGDLGVLADQVRRAIAWVWTNAERFGGDRNQIYIGGHSSGAHLAAVALTTDWPAYGLPPDVLKGALLLSGLYEMEPVRLSWRRSFIAFDDAMEDAMSPIRRAAQIETPVTVVYGTLDTPEFRRQGREFRRALRDAGKAVDFLEGTSFFHQDVLESLGNPYGLAGRAALARMGLASAALQR